MGYKFNQPLRPDQLKAKEDKIKSQEQDELNFAMAAAIADIYEQLNAKEDKGNE